MKVTICVLLLATLAACCPDEKNCRKCDYKFPESPVCDICENTIKNVITHACEDPKLKIADCEEYGAHADPEEKTLVCIRCRLGFILKDNNCVACPINNCAVCTQLNTCKACFNGKVPSANQEQCTDVNCGIPNCDLCKYEIMENPPVCGQCKKGFAVSETNGLCVQTKKDNCQLVKDIESDKCDTCLPGYYLTKDFGCAPSGSNPGPGPGPKSMIWTILLVLVIVGLIAGGIFYFLQKRRVVYRRPNEPLIN